MKARFYVVQYGFGLFGEGSTPAAAIRDANSNMDRSRPDSLLCEDSISTYVGRSRSASGRGAKLLTDRGELSDGEMVLVDAATAREWGYIK